MWLCTPCGIDLADDSPTNPGNNAGMNIQAYIAVCCLDVVALNASCEGHQSGLSGALMRVRHRPCSESLLVNLLKTGLMERIARYTSYFS